MHTLLTTYPKLSLVPVGLTVATWPVTRRAAGSLRLRDASVVASGLPAGCVAVVTNDADRRRKLAGAFRDFRRIYLREFA